VEVYRRYKQRLDKMSELVEKFVYQAPSSKDLK